MAPRIGSTATLLVQSHKNIIDKGQSLMEDPVRLKCVCCPLDIRDTNFTSPAGHLLFLTNMTVSATPAVVCIIHGLQDVQQHTQHRLHILVDEDIHHLVLKLMCSICYAQYNLPLFLTLTRVM